jgi:hypothetical protein
MGTKSDKAFSKNKDLFGEGSRHTRLKPLNPKEQKNWKASYEDEDEDLDEEDFDDEDDDFEEEEIDDIDEDEDFNLDEDLSDPDFDDDEEDDEEEFFDDTAY